MASSYTDLQTYRSCPRLFGFQKLGYTPIATTEPLATGSLVHIGLTSYLKSGNAGRDMNTAAKIYLDCVKNNLSGNERYEAAQVLDKALDRAMALVKRYTLHWAKDYKATLIEPELELDGVICHPDLIATYQDKRVIVDFTTSYHPDERWYDISNQTDLYAYIHNRIAVNSFLSIDLIIYDIISEEGLFRHMRPPRLEAGKRLFKAVQALDNLITRVNWPSDAGYTLTALRPFLDDPYPNYTCPSRCDFFHPCWLLETGSWYEVCRDYLEENYLK